MIKEIIVLTIINILKFKKTKTFKKEKIYKRGGEYKTILSNCISCHTIQGGKPFTGGYSFKTIFGVINTPNITKNKKFGIGNLKLKNFFNIIKNGISKKGIFLFPILPYINYKKIKKKDIKEIFLFLKKIKNENVVNKNNSIKFPFKYRNALIGWRSLFFKNNNFKKTKKKSNIKRGEYIFKTLAHCDMCHTKTNIIGRKNKYFKYKGNSIIDKWKATEITNNKNEGIKKENVKSLWNLLKKGISKKKNIGGIMGEVITNSLQYTSKIDLFSITRYLKSNINDKIILELKNKKKSEKKYKIIKKTYKKECLECHGKISMGNYPIYPKIIKNKKNKLKNLKNILSNNNITNTIKNRYHSIMPTFINIKNKIIEKYLKINQKL